VDIQTAGGLTFTARATGPEAARPVLLLHGFPETSRCWTAQLDALGDAGYRAVAFDQRGYSPGACPRDVTAYRPEALVADVLAVADTLGYERFDLVGHDFGGSVGWMVAGHHPGRVRSLSIASTPHPAAFASTYRASPDQSERSGYMRSFRAGGRGEVEAALLAHGAAGLRAIYTGLPAEAVEDYVEALSKPGALVAAVDWYRSMSARASAATPPAAMPTLYVWSDQDPTLGREAAEATREHTSGRYRFEVLHGVGHWIPELAAARFTELLLDHLATS
jgi:pimeloyl-ACP methyl ester carboxylesterase